MPRRKADGIGALLEDTPVPSIEEINLRDWYAAFALMSGADPVEAFELADQMIQERKK